MKQQQQQQQQQIEYGKEENNINVKGLDGKNKRKQAFFFFIKKERIEVLARVIIHKFWASRKTKCK